MAEDEQMCAACSSPTPRSFPLDDVTAAAADGVSVPGSTLLLSRPATTGSRNDVRFRDPEKSRRIGTMLLLLVAILAVLGVLGTMAMRGDGPLASTAVSLGLTDPPAVDVPRNWATTTSAEGKFSVELPLGSAPLTTSDHPPFAASPGFVGYSVDLGTEGRMLVLSSEVGGGSATIDDAGLNWLVDTFVADGRYGTETVRRDGLISTGPVKDSVIVDGDSHAARVRFHLSGGRLHVLATVGPDDASRKLDEAHSRLLESFEPQR